MKRTNEEIVKEIQDGVNVKKNYEILFKQNEPLLNNIVKKYVVACEMEDLKQMSFIGLVEAVKHFSFDEGVKFMSYAPFRINSYIQDQLTTLNGVHVSKNIKTKFFQYKRFIRDYEKENESNPPFDVIKEKLGITTEELDCIRALNTQTLSLNESANKDGEEIDEYENIIPSDENVEEDVIENEYRRFLKVSVWDAVQSGTDARAFNILKEQFVNDKSLQEIGSKLGISAERVRQISEKHLNRLQKNEKILKCLWQIDKIDTLKYHGGLGNYKNGLFTSCVEKEVIRKDELNKKISSISDSYFRRYIVNQLSNMRKEQGGRLKINRAEFEELFKNID